MNFKRLKAKYARKLLTAKYFVLLTDKESAIAMEGVDPESIDDMMALYAQTASLKDFLEKLTKLVDDHDKAITARGKSGVKVVKKTNTTKRKPNSKQSKARAKAPKH